MKKIKKRKMLHDRDRDLIDFDRMPKSIDSEKREELYEKIRKDLEFVVDTMKGCTTKILVSRRDFISKGLIAGGSFLSIPRISKKQFSMFSETHAQSGSGNPGCFVVSSDGGPMYLHEIISGNNVPGDLSNTAYRAMGMLNNQLPSNNNFVDSFGLKWTAQSASTGFLRGIQQGAGNAYNQLSGSVKAVIVHSATRDDGGSRRTIGITGPLCELFGPGLSTNAAASESTESGTKFKEAWFLPSATPVLVRSGSAAESLPGGSPPGGKETPDYAGNASTANTLIYSTLERLAQMGFARPQSVAQIKQDMIRQEAESLRLLNTQPAMWVPNVLNASDSQNLQAIYNSQVFSSSSQRNELLALAHLVSNNVGGDRICRVVGSDQGGGDYHSGSSAPSRAITYNNTMGRMVGAAMATFASRGVPGCFVTVCNGSMAGGSNNDSLGGKTWSSDDPNTCIHIAWLYNPNGSAVPSLKQSGKYNVGGISGVTSNNRLTIRSGSGFEFATDEKLGLIVLLANLVRFFGKDPVWTSAANKLGFPSLASLENWIVFNQS